MRWRAKAAATSSANRAVSFGAQIDKLDPQRERVRQIFVQRGVQPVATADGVGGVRAVVGGRAVWFEGGVQPGRPVLNYFKVKTSEGRVFLLRYNSLFDAWAVRFPPKSTH